MHALRGAPSAPQRTSPQSRAPILTAPLRQPSASSAPRHRLSHASSSGSLQSRPMGRRAGGRAPPAAAGAPGPSDQCAVALRRRSLHSSVRGAAQGSVYPRVPMPTELNPCQGARTVPGCNGGVEGEGSAARGSPVKIRRWRLLFQSLGLAGLVLVPEGVGFGETHTPRGRPSVFYRWGLFLQPAASSDADRLCGWVLSTGFLCVSSIGLAEASVGCHGFTGRLEEVCWIGPYGAQCLPAGVESAAVRQALRRRRWGGLRRVRVPEDGVGFTVGGLSLPQALCLPAAGGPVRRARIAILEIHGIRDGSLDSGSPPQALLSAGTGRAIKEWKRRRADPWRVFQCGG
ncbi:hypothetical protein NDU88_005870, partial [Pleurodeles waltl]